jgi:hypothetical protein
VAPLYDLLKKNNPWQWTDREQAAFQKAKDRLLFDTCLCHYQPNLPLVVDCDASPIGIGATLSHQYPDGSLRPLAFASRKLSETEQRYAQIEKEGLAIVYSLRKFHHFLFGRQFLLHTDHKPLLHLMGPKQGIPLHAVSRLSRWALILADYQYRLEYIDTDHMPADYLSRLPTGASETEPCSGDRAINAIAQENIEATAVDVQALQRATKSDPMLAPVLNFVTNGWPRDSLIAEPEQHRLKLVQNSLSVYEGF